MTLRNRGRVLFALALLAASAGAAVTWPLAKGGRGELAAVVPVGLYIIVLLLGGRFWLTCPHCSRSVITSKLSWFALRDDCPHCGQPLEGTWRDAIQKAIALLESDFGDVTAGTAGRAEAERLASLHARSRTDPDARAELLAYLHHVRGNLEHSARDVPPALHVQQAQWLERELKLVDLTIERLRAKRLPNQGT